MNKFDLYSAIDNIDDDIVSGAARIKKHKAHYKMIAGIAAACLVLVLMLGFGMQSADYSNYTLQETETIVLSNERVALYELCDLSRIKQSRLYFQTGELIVSDDVNVYKHNDSENYNYVII